MLRRLFRYLFRLVLVVLGLILLGVLLLLTPPVQTFVARSALKRVNAAICGRVELGSLHATLGGRVTVRAVRLLSPQGNEILSLDSLRAQTSWWALVRNSVHVHFFDAGALTLNLELDTAGKSNLEHALALRQPPTGHAKKKARPFAWRVDSVRVQGGRLSVRKTEHMLFECASWVCRARAAQTGDTLRLHVRAIAPRVAEFELSGVAALTDSFPAFAGDVRLQVDSAFTVTLPPPFPRAGALTAGLDLATREDSLFISADARCALGRLRLAAAAPYPPRTPAGRGTLVFDSLRAALLWHDSSACHVNGRLQFTKAPSGDLVNGWDAKLELRETSYAGYTLPAARMSAHTADSQAVVRGDIHASLGKVRFTVEVRNFDPAAAQMDLNAEFSDLALARFLPALPDSLAPLAGTLRVRGQQLADERRRTVVAALELKAPALGGYDLDNLTLHAQVHGDSFSLDSLCAGMGGAKLKLRADGARQRTVAWFLDADVPDLHCLSEKVRSLLPAEDTLRGALALHLSGAASLAGDSLSHLRVGGRLQVRDAAYGQDFALQRLELVLHEGRADDLFARADLEARGLRWRTQRVDTLAISVSGTADKAAVSLNLSAQTDTVAVAADFELARTARHTDVTLNRFAARAYGIPWESESQTTFTLSGGEVSVDALALRSPVGVMRASGTLRQRGEQDLALELSGFRTGEVARLLRLRLPEGTVNARVQLSGPDTAVVGDLQLAADSVILDGNPLADAAELHATIDRSRALLDGWVVWFGDTLALLEGEFPARLSFADGLTIADSLPMRGALTLREQPLRKLNGYLPFGTSVDGRISGSATFSGTPRQPHWSGRFTVRDGSYSDLRNGVRYRNLFADGELSADTLRIRELSATAGGKVTGSGWAIMAFPLPRELHLGLKFKNFELLDSPLMAARATGHVALDGPLTALSATGEVQLSEVRYRISQATTKQIEEIDLAAELARQAGDTTKPVILLSRFYRGMSHALFVDLPGNCWLRGGGLNIELYGSLWLNKEHRSEPAVNGEILVRQGRLQFFGRELRVTEGTVRFDGPLTELVLDIRATDPRLAAQGTNVDVHVFGPLTRMQIEMSGTDASGFAMTPDQIVAAITFGRAAQAGFAAGATTAELQDALTLAATSQLSGLVGNLAGIDMFEYRPGEGGLADLTSGSLEVGTYVTDRLFVRVLQPIQATQLAQEVSVEYRLLNWLKIRAQQTGRQSSALDVLFQLDWK